MDAGILATIERQLERDTRSAFADAKTAALYVQAATGRLMEAHARGETGALLHEIDMLVRHNALENLRQAAARLRAIQYAGEAVDYARSAAAAPETPLGPAR